MTNVAHHAELHYSRGRSLRDKRPDRRTAADLADFIAQLDSDRAPAKEGAAYICGPLNSDGRRCKAGALPRRWVGVDLDRIEASVLAAVVRWFGRYSAACWPTHSSAPDAPRLRVIIELDRPASRDQCIAIGVQMAADLRDEFGDAVFLDTCTFLPEQAVHVPPTGAVIQHFDGAPLEVTAELSPAGSESDSCTEEGQKVTEVGFCSLPSSSVQAAAALVGGAPWTIPPGTHLTESGQRNERLFLLARHARAIQPPPTPDELRGIVRTWSELAVPAARTMDFAVAFAEFMRAYGLVNNPFGATLDNIIGNIDKTSLPAGIDSLGYGEAGNLLVNICAALHAHENGGVFFLGARQAGELVGAPFRDANRMMQTLQLDGVMELVTKGSGKKASRYRFVWPATSAASARSPFSGSSDPKPSQLIATGDSYKQPADV